MPSSSKPGVLVTGGAGFIGSHLADAYLADGWRVFIVDNLSTGAEKWLQPEAEFIHSDIRIVDFDNLLAKADIRLVNHHAAQIDVRKSVADPLLDTETNIIGSIRLLEACRKRPKCAVIFASSGGAIYGEQARFPADEEHPKQPLSPYGINKLTIEQYMFYLSNEYHLPGTALRYANVYGPRQNSRGEAGVVAIFCDRMKRGQTVTINGDGLQTRDFVFVSDVVAANLAAIPKSGFTAYNIGTGIETNVVTLFEKLSRYFNDNFSHRFGPAAAGEQRRSSISPLMAARQIKWTPKVALDEGLRQTAEWFKAQAD